ncbi:TetR/AcrR family transcriptional regulator [Nitratifractor salsuginis]|uniref:Transcriptional regulator, TetR family n=1 Tax=Nitratifractor salsuginis (strain DSM 16511 / JCM 12458 / E9I37-1) TaxID=749222 RepID=E6X132_NITSE|nr:TetR/AcrR family transcriptional regulator [Nitratifractor salsuginis]ADV45835.1 transcriptional regulator, TetR family [Nitratifractor salsuginis DSM 16511]
MNKNLSKKDRIVDAAARLFARHGYSKTVLEDVAGACGITKPAIYYHFKDKQALYEAVLCQRFALIARKIDEETRKEDPLRALEAYVETFGYYLIEDPHFGTIFARELADGARDLPERCIKNLSQILKRLDEILQEGRERKLFHEENPFMIQLMIVSTLSNYQSTYELREKVLRHLDGEKEHINPELEDIIPNLREKILKALTC